MAPPGDVAPLSFPKYEAEPAAYHGCSHVSDFVATGGLSSFRVLQQYAGAVRFRSIPLNVAPRPSAWWPHALPASASGTAADAPSAGNGAGTALPLPVCAACPEPHWWRLMICCHCVYCSCMLPAHQHAAQHATARRHPLAYDFAQDQVYCFECNDYQYDQRLDLLRVKHHDLAFGVWRDPAYAWLPVRPSDEAQLMDSKELAKLHGHVRHPVSSSVLKQVAEADAAASVAAAASSSSSATAAAAATTAAPRSDAGAGGGKASRKAGGRGGKRKTPDDPDEEWGGGSSKRSGNGGSAADAAGKRSVVVVRAAFNQARHNTLYNATLGLRGIYNLGNTCFMNCVLQTAFVHNPLLRNFFLSDCHNRNTCPRGGANSDTQLCIACEIDSFYAQMFSGRRVPYNPHRLLYSMWRFADYLAGYEQQDAHEFLISLLNGVHVGLGGTHSRACPCAVHRIFSGVLRSTLACTSCGATSIAYDPFLDLSMDLRKPKGASAPTTPLSPSRSVPASLLGLAPDMLPGTPRIASDGMHHTLSECLARFTSVETLGEHKMYCDKCLQPRVMTKQMAIHRLPAVLVLHLKRFKFHGGSRSEATKLDTPIRFPLQLDMSNFITSAIVRRRHGESGAPFPTALPARMHLPAEHASADAPMHLHGYDLFGVVNHHGTLASGHYTSFVRRQDDWFRCDDTMVSKASVQAVLHSEAYVLLYTRRQMHYAADPDTSGGHAAACSAGGGGSGGGGGGGGGGA